MDPVLSVPLLLFIILLVFVIFVPAGMERRAKRNRAERDSAQLRLRELNKASARHARVLAPYADVKSVLLRDAADVSGSKYAQFESHLSHITASLNALKCPPVPAYLLPLQHFLTKPGDFADILNDSIRLSRIRSHLSTAAQESDSVAESLAELAAMPERIVEMRRALVARLDAIDLTLRGERATGVEALGPWQAMSRQERERLARQQTDTPANAPVRTLDAGAMVLEEVAEACGRLEGSVALLVRERQQLDARRERVSSELDSVQATSKAGSVVDAPPETGRLLREAAKLLNEDVSAARQAADFAAAGTSVEVASRLVVLARDLTDAHRGLGILEARDYGALTEPINALQSELEALLGIMRNASPAEAASRQHSSQATELRRRTGALLVQQDAAIAELERQAAELKDQIDQRWVASQQLLRLDDEDPLARRYARLSIEYETAQQHPTALEEYRRQVSGFESVLKPWMDRVSATQTLIERNRARLPDLIDAASATAGSWQCLSEHVRFIQQRTADFERLRGRFSMTHHRRQAETLMDQLETVERDIDERFAVLREQAARLGFLEQDVRQIMTMAGDEANGSAPDDPERPRRERALGLIAHHLAQAHSAARYEDASLALARAADLANKLAM